MDPGSPLSTREQRIQQLLDQASQLPAPERDVFLSRECGEDQALRQQINEHLLTESRGMAKKKLEGRPGPVTSAVTQALIGSEHDRRVELLGKVVGDYRLVAIVGAGGAGTVYLGERADRAYSAQVAIKVVANTQLNHEVQRRFAAERQILANLNHPYIGRLLDAGETFFDEPFLVMEYVHGEAIDRYCDNQRLSVVERIQLFLKICDAVQYAHRNLIVHRDLKPGNILVSKEGIPKLLDFGIAKLLDDSAMAVLQDGVIAHTRVHDRLLTPEYASPEQIRGQAVTTTSDVYALGVILYELLTGVRPYAVNSLNQLELERSICIQDVIKPSQRVSLLEKESHSTNTEAAKISLIATARNTSFKTLEHQLQGDLDAIVLRALRKEPEKRYSSVEHLIDDLNRHLNQEPVEARQGNRWYYTQRFVTRHTVGVIAGTTALLSLIAVAIILSIQANQLKQQRDIATQQRDKATQESQRAETVSNFMLDVFTAADPFQSQDKQVTAKELLDNAAKKIETTLNDQPEVKARLLEAIGNAYLNQGQSGPAIEYLNSAIHAQRERPIKNGLKLAALLNSLGRAYTDQGKFDDAQHSLKEAHVEIDKSGQIFSNEYLQADMESAYLATRMSQPAVAQKLYEDALTTARRIYGDAHSKTAGVLVSLARSMMWQSNYLHAESLVREAISIYQRTLPAKHPERMSADLSLGEIQYHLGRYEEAISLINKVLEDQKAVFGNKNAQLINTYYTLTMVYLTQSKFESAARSAQLALEIANTTLGGDNFMTGVMHSAVANVLIKQKQYHAAQQEASISLETLKRSTTPDHQYLASAEYLLAASLVGQHHEQEAEPILHDNIARWARGEAAPWRAARSESLLGSALMQLKQPIEAWHLLSHSNDALSAVDSGADTDAVAISKMRIEQYQQCAAAHKISTCHLVE